jgi:hypothetical protein
MNAEGDPSTRLGPEDRPNVHGGGDDTTVLVSCDAFDMGKEHVC